MKPLFGQSLLEVITSLSLLSLLCALGLQLSLRLTDIHSPTEQQITRRVVQNMLWTPPNLDAESVEIWQKGRRLEGNLTLISGDRGLYQWEVSAFVQDQLVERQSRYVRKESLRTP